MSLIQWLKHLVLAPEVLSLCALHPSVCLPAATLKLIQSCNMHFLVLRLSFNTKESVFPPCRINYFVHYLFFSQASSPHLYSPASLHPQKIATRKFSRYLSIHFFLQFYIHRPLFFIPDLTFWFYFSMVTLKILKYIPNFLFLQLNLEVLIPAFYLPIFACFNFPPKLTQSQTFVVL